MKKIPTLFERVFENNKVVGVNDKVTPGMEWVLNGEGIATEKYDGSCCAIIDGELYRRYDAKKGKKPPEGAIPCCEPDPVTGHWPHWVKVDPNNPADKWHVEARANTEDILKEYLDEPLPDHTYEAVGPHFQNNPYGLDEDHLWEHGAVYLDVERSFDGIREFLKEVPIEGIVFWKDGEPMCKIKRSDFGFEWPRTDLKEK